MRPWALLFGGTVPSAFSDVSLFLVTFLPLAAQSPGLGHFPKPPTSLRSQPLSHQHPISKGPGSQLTALRKERGSIPTTISWLVAASCVSLLMWSFCQVDHSSTPALPSPGGPCGPWCRALLRGTPVRLRGWRYVGDILWQQKEEFLNQCIRTRKLCELLGSKALETSKQTLEGCLRESVSQGDARGSRPFWVV